MYLITRIYLTQDEVSAAIPYRLIDEIRYGARWDTQLRKRKWRAEFTYSEREAAYVLFKRAADWNRRSGVPKEGVSMSTREFDLWQKLGSFCACI